MNGEQMTVVSTSKMHEGYDSRIGVSIKYDTYLDGIKIDRCFYANDKEGIIGVYAVDKNGDYIIENDCPQQEFLYGNVHIVRAS